MGQTECKTFRKTNTIDLTSVSVKCACKIEIRRKCNSFVIGLAYVFYFVYVAFNFAKRNGG